MHPRRVTTLSMKAIWKAVYCLSCLAHAISAARAHPHDFEGWLNTNTHIALDHQRQYQLYLEAQPRVADNWQRAATFQGRVALAYTIDRAVSLYLGYAWTPALYDSNYHRDYRDEQRLWQQLTFRHDLFGLHWQHRLRQEQRMVMRTDGVASRTRYLTRGSYALDQEESFGLTAFNEIMINLNALDNGPWKGYDRNRIFFGPYWVIGPGRYEVGYLGEHLKRFGSDERWAHVLQLSASYNH